MQVIRARNVHHALPLGIELLQKEGVQVPSRNGPAWEHPEPVATAYAYPRERVLFWPERDANPFFHLLEALWMLDGRDDVASLAVYNSRIAQYSDDGATFHGAYGYRWRVAFGKNQLKEVAEELRTDPLSRRAVLQMWHAPWDLRKATKDQPCNTHAYFKVRDGKLLMTVCCRSNDIVWGAYGANAVHFSILQEYLAEQIGVDVGSYVQISDSFHAYEGVWEKCYGLPTACTGWTNPYLNGLRPASLESTDSHWQDDLKRCFDSGHSPILYRSSFFRDVVGPLQTAWAFYKAGRWDAAMAATRACASADWSRAAREWLQRRAK